MILAFVCMGKRSAQMYLEIKYIKEFSQEDLYEKHDACQCLAQIESAIEKLISGVEGVYQMGQQGTSSMSESRSHTSFSASRKNS